MSNGSSKAGLWSMLAPLGIYALCGASPRARPGHCETEKASDSMTISRPPVVFGANWITLVRAALCGRPGLVRRAFCCLDRTFHPDNSRRELLLCSGLLLFLASPSSIHAQEPDRQELEQSCRTYVQRFYTWYVRLSEKDTPHAQDLALKRFAFSPELVRGLREDSRAQTRYSDQGIVGLDFDPFIGGNGGPLGRYVVGRIKPMSGHYFGPGLYSAG